ncbi:MAG: autotransporter domain-containing protein, partial [Thalassospira sp.]|uniref:autotransporter domain-containing protein n=1 Tax=Thalassospira sp. TaxID=1912094 RepID=UPI0032EDC68F
QPVEDLPLSLVPSLGVMASRKNLDRYTESDGTAISSTHSNTRQVNPGIEASYDISATSTLFVTPFVNAGLVQDFTDEINNDKTAFNLGGGLRLFDSQTGLNGAIEGSYLAGRTAYQEYTLSGTVTYGFAINDGEGRDLGIIKPFFSSKLNEYGNQRIRTGFGFDSGDLSSELALSHRMSIADDNDASDDSALELKITMTF